MADTAFFKEVYENKRENVNKETDFPSNGLGKKGGKLPDFKIGISTLNLLSSSLEKHQQRLPILPVKMQDHLLWTWLLPFIQVRSQ